MPTPILNTVPPHFFSSLLSETIEIVAESGQKRFFVHSHVLSIAAAQSGISDITKHVLLETGRIEKDLSDWDGDTVGRFIEFLYYENYRFPEQSFKEEETEDEDVGGRDCVHTPDTEHSLEGKGRPEKTNPLLVHAKVYALAQYQHVEALRSMALERLRVALESIDGRMSVGGVAAGFIGLLGYVYSLADPSMGPGANLEEPIRNLVSAFAVKNFEELVKWRGMKLLLSEGGDIVVELLDGVARRLYDGEGYPDAEGRIGVRKKLGEVNKKLSEVQKRFGGVEKELEEWKNRAATSDEAVRGLRATNTGMLQQFEAAKAKIGELQVANAEKDRELEGTNAKLQLEIVNAEALRQASSEAANAERIRKLESASAARVRELESASAARIRELERDSAARIRELESTSAAEIRTLENKIKYLTTTIITDTGSSSAAIQEAEPTRSSGRRPQKRGRPRR